MGNKSTFRKPHEFGRIKELFNPTLLNLTLFMAIASFSLSYITDVTPQKIMEVFSKMGIENISQTCVNWVYFFIFAVMCISLVITLLCALVLVFTWIISNLIRFINGKRNKTIKEEKLIEEQPFISKINIHIETNQPLEDAINRLIDRLK